MLTDNVSGKEFDIKSTVLSLQEELDRKLDNLQRHRININSPRAEKIKEINQKVDKKINSIVEEASGGSDAESELQIKAVTKGRNNSIFLDTSSHLLPNDKCNIRDIKSAKQSEKKRNESLDSGGKGAGNFPRIPMNPENYFNDKRKGHNENKSVNLSRNRILQVQESPEEYIKSIQINSVRPEKRINNSFDVQSTTMMHFKVKSGEQILKYTNETTHQQILDPQRQKLQNLSLLPNSPLKLQRKSPSRPITSFLNTVTSNLSKGGKSNPLSHGAHSKNFSLGENIDINDSKPYNLLGSPEFQFKVVEEKIHRRASTRNDGERIHTFSPQVDKKTVPLEVFLELEQRFKRMELELSKAKEKNKRDKEKFEEFKLDLVRSYEEELQILNKKYEKLGENYTLLRQKQKISLINSKYENNQNFTIDTDHSRNDKNNKGSISDVTKTEEMRSRALDNQFQLNAIRTMIAVLVKVIPPEIQAEHHLDKYFALVDSLGKKMPHQKSVNLVKRKHKASKKEDTDTADESNAAELGRRGNIEDISGDY